MIKNKAGHVETNRSYIRSEHGAGCRLALGVKWTAKRKGGMTRRRYHDLWHLQMKCVR